jgi:hypothetical protein
MEDDGDDDSDDDDDDDDDDNDDNDNNDNHDSSNVIIIMYYQGCVTVPNIYFISDDRKTPSQS